ncbi:hypothetical protein [Corynebacterium rouxii]|uniref:hypothetical protein n=1 Tax=Corynebacterium rouxii TaxID=2719119 RepID=UPI00313C3413
MTRHLPGRTAGAIALVIATATAPIALPLTSPTIAIASEPTIDAMVEGYYYKPAPDGDKYTNTISTFAYISKTRHMYHSAARNQHYDAPKRTPELHEIHQRSERACFIAKARVVLALMQAEGDPQARALDISKVGIALDESRRALPLLAKSMDNHYKLYEDDKENPDRKKIDKRAKLSLEGKSATEDIIKALESGADPYEYNAFSVIDWGVKHQALHKIHHDHHMPQGMPELQKFKASIANAVNKADVDAMAEHNRSALAASLPMSAPVQSTTIKQSHADKAESSSTIASIWNHIATFFTYLGIAAGIASIISWILSH